VNPAGFGGGFAGRGPDIAIRSLFLFRMTFHMSRKSIGMSHSTSFIFILLVVGTSFAAVDGGNPVVIPGDTEHGTWDPQTRTYTLTGEVIGEIQVGEDSLTLDGGGNRVRSPARGNGQGILLDGRTGITIHHVVIGDFARQILLRNAHGNTITRNVIGGEGFEHVHGRGIYLQESHGNTVTGNTIARHSGAVSLEGARDNTFVDNRIAQDQGASVRIFGQSSGNRFVHNLFIENRSPVDISEYSQGNIFSLSRPVGGNFWDHYTEPDANGDGFVDTAFSFAGGEDLLPWVKAEDWPRETAAASGLSGMTRVEPGGEVALLTVGLTGNGYERLRSVTFTLEDLSAPTGLGWEDLKELRLYRSRDRTLSGIEYRLGTLDQGAIQLGSPSTIAVTRIERPPEGVEKFYLVTAVLNTEVIDGHAFRVGFASGGVKMDGLDLGSEVRTFDANRVVVDVRATRLMFNTQPGDAASGQFLGLQPVVTACDEHGNIDREFAEAVTLSLAGVGSLSVRGQAQEGVVRFSGVIYSAKGSGEAFRLVADDESGVGADLPPVHSDLVHSH
jgi:parallel beta-helix repeat protein